MKEKDQENYSATNIPGLLSSMIDNGNHVCKADGDCEMKKLTLKIIQIRKERIFHAASWEPKSTVVCPRGLNALFTLQ